MKAKAVWLAVLILLLVVVPVTASEWVPHFFDLPRVENRDNHREIVIEGSEEFVTIIEDALELLYETDYAAYMIVRQNLRTVREVRGYSGVHVRQGLFDYHPDFWYMREDRRTAWVASCLLHEATHVWLYRHGYEYAGRRAEEFCNSVQAQFILKAGHRVYAKWLLEDVFEARWWE